MGQNSLAVEMREITSKGSLNQIRLAGWAPGVVYGGQKPSTAIKFKARDLDQLISKSSKGRNTLIEIKTNTDEVETVMLREMQWEPIKHILLHADFYRISLDDVLQTEVPITWVGEAKGVKEGGMMQTILRSVVIECLPTQIPDSLEVQVGDLEIGDKISVSDLVVPEGITILNESDEVVVSILAAREEEPAGDEGAAEEASAEGDSAASEGE